MSAQMRELLQASASELGLELSADNLGKFILLAGELKKWNRKINLTAITCDRDIVLKHFADSLALIRLVGEIGCLLDVGSGGGFPSLPLKIMLPKLAVTSVDSVGKKILFQRHAARALELENFTAIHARCEDLGPGYAEHFDWIVSRAFSDIPAFAEIAAPLVKPEGRIIAMKGKGGWVEGASAVSRLSELGLVVEEVIDFLLPVSGDPRSLVVMKKRRFGYE